MTAPAPLPPPRSARTARLMLVVFLLSFVSARVLVLLIVTRILPDLYLYVGQTHVHHLNYGIFMLAGVGAYLLFLPAASPPQWVVVTYAVGLALTFDEFGMWLHLGGPYWQRASFDAVVIILALLSLIAVAPSRFHAIHWAVAALLLLLLGAFLWLLSARWDEIARRIAPRFQQIENHAPR